MYAAKIELGWVNKCFEGESASDILGQVEAYHFFGVLLRMGRMEEGGKRTKGIR